MPETYPSYSDEEAANYKESPEYHDKPANDCNGIEQHILEAIHHAEAAQRLCERNPILSGIGMGKGMTRFYLEQALDRLATALSLQG